MGQPINRAAVTPARRRVRFGTVLVICAMTALWAAAFVAAPDAKTLAHRGGSPAISRHHAARHSAAKRSRRHAGRHHGQTRTGSASGPVSSAQMNAINRRVDALLAQMTVQEKFGQLTQSQPQGPNGTAGPTLEQAVQNGEVGSILDMVGVNNINSLQQYALKSRLHIPLIFALDVIHGYKTMYPISLGESSAWDPTLAQNDAAMAANEATADGLKWTFSPMVDVTRDPRWGRVEGTSGEDPFLGAALAAARVTGYQGSDYGAQDRMAATIKHFAAYGAPVAGREYNTVDMSIQQLYNDYLPTYKAAVDAGAATVMSSFNSLNGVPNTANPFTLKTILRNQWGFGGTTISDYQAVQQLEGPDSNQGPTTPGGFGYAADGAQAAQDALTAGVDIEMAVDAPFDKYTTYDDYGPQLLAEHRITMQELNTAVRHVLTLKFLAGMFAHPIATDRTGSAELTSANLDQARTAADESMVLLNNDKSQLPFSTSLHSVAVIGPLANDPSDQLGPDVPIGYDLSQGKVVSVYQGIKNALPNATVTYSQGCDTSCTDTSGFAAAQTAAQGADAVVLAVGEPASDSGEASSRTDLSLPGQQAALVQAIESTGKPVAVVLMNGRPLTLGPVATVPSLLEAWYPGTEGGNAVADAVFGKVNPAGALPMSFPVNVGQVPVSYNELPTGRPYDPNNKYTSRYLDAPNAPQYAFGYGLSYTTFSLSNLTATPSTTGRNGPEVVTAEVTNTGSRAGTDVVQLYLHENYTPLLQPVRKLEGFQRVTLAPGQTRSVRFVLTGANLGYYDNSGRFDVVPGPFDVWVGDGSQTDVLHSTFTVR